MIRNVSFRRKVLYLALIALLLIPLYMIGNPATGDPLAADSTPGGKLAQLRAQYDLSQAELGEIDPASESMKLATLGLRGVAVNVLWTKANRYRKTENWEALVAVVNQMAKLQPNFISVWEFQSHNLSYNISVEHDDYRFRYLWVKKGIDFLIQGTRYNRREPKLFWTVGFYTGQKFGRSDEQRQFRGLFADDGEFHEMLSSYVPVDSQGRGASGKPDSWLVSKLWFEDAYNIIDTQGVPLRGKSPHIFYADGPKAQMNYATAIEAEGYLDEKAEYAWRTASNDWADYGQKLFPTSWGENIRLADMEAKLAETQRLQEELDALAPGAREQILEEKRATLSDKERAALETEITPETYVDRTNAIYKTQVTHREVADRAPSEVRSKAFRLADRATSAAVSAERIGHYRRNVNFEYWLTRCLVEQQSKAVEARRHMYEANEAMDRVELDLARRRFEQAWDNWHEILQEHPVLFQRLMADDLLEEITRYVELLSQLDEELPEDFKLRHLLELREETPEPTAEPMMISEPNG